jgi:peroxisomal 3,2-trans-enoyl-CoA isomerase
LSNYRPADYDEFANSLRAIDQREDVVATVWQGKQAFKLVLMDSYLYTANGKWFCA